MTTRSINEGNIPFVSGSYSRNFQVPYSLHATVWRIVQENKSNFITENACNECGEKKACVNLLDRTGTYYICKNCCVHIWNYVQDSIF